MDDDLLKADGSGPGLGWGQGGPGYDTDLATPWVWHWLGQERSETNIDTVRCHSPSDVHLL